MLWREARNKKRANKSLTFKMDTSVFCYVLINTYSKLIPKNYNYNCHKIGTKKAIQLKKDTDITK